MKYPKIVTLLAISCLSMSPLLVGQDNEKDDVFILSPFHVNAEDDQGYRATSTLAGTRLNTSLKDVGAAISVVTKEFLEDTNSTDAEDLLVYVANAEVAGLGGNYSAATVGNAVDTVWQTRNQMSGTRLRGLIGPTFTRDFYITGIPFDSYNTSRVVVNRGPNSILFGLGSPAGVVNNSLSTPTFSDSTEIGIEYARFGSMRYNMDIDRELIDDVLAVRIAVLNDDEKFQQDPAFDRDRRVYTSVEYRTEVFKDVGILGKTTLRAHLEVGERESNRPRISPPGDTITTWWTNANQQTLPSHTLDWRETDRNLFSIPGDWYFQPGVVYSEFDSSKIGGDGTPDAFVAITLPNIIDSGFLPGYRGIATYQDYAAGRSGWPAQLPDGRFYRDTQLLDDSIFDFRNKLLDGPNKREWADIEAYNLTFVQELFDGKAGIELAFDHQNFDGGWLDRLPGEGVSIQMDVNTHYPSGAVNPNLGRPFVAAAPQAREFLNERETLRATAYMKFDFEERIEGTLGRILGEHTFTGLANSYENYNWNASFMGAASDLNFLSKFNSKDITGNYSDVRIQHYLGDSLLNASSASGANLPNLQAIQDFPTSVNTVYWDAVEQDWATTNIQLSTYENNREGVARDGGQTLQEVDSKAFIWQSYLWDRHIVGTAGWRSDRVKSFSAGQPRRDPADNHIDLNDPNWGIDPTNPNGINEDDTFTWSVVAHSPTFIREKLPFGSEVSLHYNESENFQPGSQRFNIVGAPVSAPVGQTKDYGLTLSMFEGKFNARLNFFETSEQNVSLSGVSASSLIFLEREFRVANSQGINDGNPELANFTLPPQEILDFWGWRETPQQDGSVFVDTSPEGSVTQVTSRLTEGMELELMYNPNKQWRFMFNVSQQEASQSGLDAGIVEYIALRQNVWDSTKTLLDSAANFTAGERRWETFFKPWGVVKSQDGKLVDEIREWRWNLVANYQIAESKFKGLGVGGALRWQDEVAVGYPVITDPGTQERVFDIDSPYMSGREINGDFWITYKKKIMQDKVDWKLRLNVRNLIGEDDLITIAVQPDGRPSGVRIPQGTLWQVSNTFSF
jgi:outer membrane receptor protein involved in Fe transport